MKKLFLIAPIALMLFASCGGEKEETTTEETTTEETTTDSVAVSSTEETISKDTAAFACACEKKCSTKEECEKNCGADCQSGK